MNNLQNISISFNNIKSNNSTYPNCSIEEGLYNHGKNLETALFSLLLPLVISNARYWASPDFSIPPNVSSLSPDCNPLLKL